MNLRCERLLLLVAFLCFAAVGIALASQYLLDMQPCAWCVLQRLVYLIIGIVALAGALGGRLARRGASSVIMLLSAVGASAAWYQYHVAAKLVSCDQTFADRFMSATGLDGALPGLFGIYATCMDAEVTVMGLEYAIWSLLLFAVLFFFTLALLVRRR